MNTIPNIKLYGTSSCHKTKYYKTLLDETKLPYQFLDVALNRKYAEELRDLYENRKLNFPTITIGKKKLRNPNDGDLEKWLNKLIPSRLSLHHDKENKQFKLEINGEIAKVDYELCDNKMYLTHTEVPYNLRGKGIGKILVEKTFIQLTQESYKIIAICTYIKAIASRSEKWKTIIEH